MGKEYGQWNRGSLEKEESRREGKELRRDGHVEEEKKKFYR